MTLKRAGLSTAPCGTRKGTGFRELITDSYFGSSIGQE
jgi:hypothetical protein